MPTVAVALALVLAELKTGGPKLSPNATEAARRAGPLGFQLDSQLVGAPFRIARTSASRPPELGTSGCDGARSALEPLAQSSS